MGAVGGLFLALGLFFTYRAFTAPELFGGGRRLRLFGESAGKIDCGLAALLMFFGAFEFLWNM